MNPLLIVDVVVFLAFIAAVVTVGISKSRHESDSEGYFLAGRGLTWYLIGFSLIAANISTEQFVGQSGQAARHVGLAIASYEWLAAITLVFVAFFFLPSFLRAGIYTIPEFLEYRFNRHARSIMSFLMMLIYVLVTLPAVIYSGAKTGEVVFGENQLFGMQIDVVTVSWILGILAAVYVAVGGLKACAWADLLQGSALIVGGAIVLVLAVIALGQASPAALPVEQAAGAAQNLAQAGAWERFHTLNADKLHMVLPATDQFVPWTALILGLWIPNLYYWGLNQYIMQRTLGSQSLAQGQKGVVFAAGLKLLIPFIIIFPGMIAFNLFHEDMKTDAAEKTNRPTLALFDKHKNDSAAKSVFPFDEQFAKLYPDKAQDLAAFNCRVAGIQMAAGKTPFEANQDALKAIAAKNAAPTAAAPIELQSELIGYQYDAAFGLLLKRLVPVGLFGFMVAAILGAVTSTLAAMLNAASTIFTMDIYRHYLNKTAAQSTLVLVGRISVVVCMVIGCLIAPLLGHPKFKGIFTFIQEFQGFISPGILAVFLYGLFVKRAPRACGVMGLLLSPVAYGLLMYLAPQVAFLDRMAIAFFAVMIALGIMSVVRPLREPIIMPAEAKIELAASRGAKLAGIGVVLVTAALYLIFW